MDLLEIMRNRRSVRKYTQKPISDERIEKILQAGLLSASSRGIRPWEFILVRERETLEKMAACRDGAANMLKGAAAAIVVIADAEKSDVWVEDCAIAMSNMHLMADALGVGSCWIQGRLRVAAGGGSTEDYLRQLLGFPERFKLEAILSLGMSEKHPAAYELDTLLVKKAHEEQF
ncbi:MAG: nitroreductase [Firmicutes bacterium]|jgi:nitroreductase|nr:nitroreductase [Bacillota bacterium]